MVLFSSRLGFRRRWCQPCSPRYCLYLLPLIGVYFTLNPGIFHRSCSLEIPKSVQKMIENAEFSATLPTSSSDHWQRATASADVFVYSAYIEKKDRIRVIGAVSTTSASSEDLYCLLWYRDVARAPILAKACVVYVCEGINTQRLCTVYFVCPLTGNSIPDVVSIADKPHVNSPLNFLIVHKQLAPSAPFSVTACVSPIHVKAEGIVQKCLVDWIEAQKVLGVELFTVYVHNITDSDLKVLKYYESMEILEIMNWTLSDEILQKSDRPMVRDMYYFGQVTAYNDCLYRNKGRSMYTVAIDLDELIVPHMKQDFTLMEMLNRLPSRGSYLFRQSTFFAETHPDHLKCKEYGLDVHMMDSFQRKSENLDSKKNKIMFKPDEVATVAIRYTKAMLGHGEEHVVDPSIAKLHHYKFGAKSKYTVEDRAAEKYLEKVLANKKWTLNAIQNLTN